MFDRIKLFGKQKNNKEKLAKQVFEYAADPVLVLDEKQKHPDLEDNNWERSNRVPCKGEERIVFFGFPFHYCIGESFYSMFYPASVCWNGWGSAEEIESTAIVKCKFISVLTKNETSAWIKIKVEEVIMLSELLEQIPPVESDTYFVTV